MQTLPAPYDPVLEFLIDRARAHRCIRRMILFGSRSKDSSNERSDYDVAVESTGPHSDWAAWVLAVREDVPTLCGLDLINLAEPLSEPLLNAIHTEGKVFYDING